MVFRKLITNKHTHELSLTHLDSFPKGARPGGTESQTKD